MKHEEFQILQLAEITESKTNPRQHFDDGLIRELADSINQQGVLQPVLVRPKGKKKFELVAGARRFRASKLAGKADIPARVKELNDDQVFEIQVIENLQRSDVHPMDEAVAFARMVARPDYTIATVAEKVGKSESYVHRRLKLNDLSDKFKKMFFDEQINIGHALELCRLTSVDQTKAEQFLSGWNGTPSVSSLRKSIESQIILNLSKAPFAKTAKDLLPDVGACTNCPKRSGFNKTLFPDIQKEDRCFDSFCYLRKANAHLEQKIQEHNEKGEELLLLSDYTGKYDSKKYKKVLQEHRDFKGTNTEECADQAPGIFLNGTDKGKITMVCANKKCQTHWKYYHGSVKGDKADPASNLKARLARGKELDAEKVQKRVVEELRTHNYLRDVSAPELSEFDFRMLFHYTIASASYNTIREILNLLNIKDNHHSGSETLINKLPELSMGQISMIIRRIVFDQYQGHLPIYSGARLLQEMAKVAGINVAAIQAEQDEIARKREERGQAKLKELEGEKKKKKERIKKRFADAAKGKKKKEVEPVNE